MNMTECWNSNNDLFFYRCLIDLSSARRLHWEQNYHVRGRAPMRSKWQGCVWAVFLVCWVRQRSQVWRPFITYCHGLVRPLQKIAWSVNQLPEWQAHHLHCWRMKGRPQQGVYVIYMHMYVHIHTALSYGTEAELKPLKDQPMWVIS